MLAALLAASIAYPATVVRPIDGDTLKVHIAGFPAAFDPIAVRVYGLDTPEQRRPPAQAACEVPKGLAAAAFAKTLIKPGDAVTVIYTPGLNDKYRRLLARVTLADGRDWATVMISGNHGRPYGATGGLHKAPWCKDAPTASGKD